MKIPIVDENDNIIGEEERSVIHKQGIRHREVHVWVVTEDKKIVFQKRAMNKDTWPGRLDATAGGHVDSATETYQEAGERELFEETGLSKTPMYIDKIYKESYDPNTDTQNNKFMEVFAVRFSGDINQLTIEKDSALGFESYSIDQLKNLSEDEKKKFITSLIGPDWIVLYEKMINVLFA